MLHSESILHWEVPGKRIVFDTSVWSDPGAHADNIDRHNRDTDHDAPDDVMGDTSYNNCNYPEAMAPTHNNHLNNPRSHKPVPSHILESRSSDTVGEKTIVHNDEVSIPRAHKQPMSNHNPYNSTNHTCTVSRTSIQTASRYIH